MKKLYVYNVYLESGDDVYKITVPAENEKDAVQYCTGNGEIVTVKKASFPGINPDILAGYMKEKGFTQEQIDVIARVLIRTGLTDL